MAEAKKTTEKTKVLLVDDEDLVRSMLAFELEMAGYAVVEAHNGKDAMEKLITEGNVDILLSDIRMPIWDGLKLLTEVRLRHVSIPPVILMSGFSDTALWNIYSRGAAAWLPKPIDFTELREALSFCIDREPGALRPLSVEHHFSFAFENEFDAFSDHGIAVAQGGMFLPLPPHFVTARLGSGASFDIQVEGKEPFRFTGKGVIRWIRRHPHTSEPHLPPGLGLSFRELSEDSKARLEGWCRKNQDTLTFIPRGPLVP